VIGQPDGFSHPRIVKVKRRSPHLRGQTGIGRILRALRGDRFERDGRPVFIRPLPMRAPEDTILVGGGVAASARRAARFNVGWRP
jgi:hypothetical protein